MSHIKRPILKLIQQFVPVVMILFITAGIAVAQSYYHSPNDTLISNTTVNNSVTMNITQVHPTNDTLQFVWKKLSVSMPNDWTATICDNNTCFPSLIDSSTTLPVLPGDDGLMLVHCYPNTNAGTGMIRYTIYEIHSPLQVDTLTWIINAESTVGISESVSINPAYTIIGDQFQLTDSKSEFTNLTLLDLNGKEVFSSSISASICLEMPLLPAHFYYLILSGNNTIIRQKIWYSIN
ncbi:MAG: hypothetical protein A3D31_16165 [Candidatus Fluviicola riflensis]|nr:MAG: hypothetical protein CHH17_01100 [Candidatus Fluviicola riflensis]OGS78489.1 MAG: hypothetical protein A3D31_16165 [Candidatus Fluviicola riflensis]OGS85555.1 MAG: hypothetical protein A2724_13100 [Fluviicola sp. RIFCSPHIGHO2_01_FULL_43_53]OGS87596.1 MAG: hypothetical protein A3E30_09520 [Fluviicola sp. RIFCSPHIGHO2_12_FULL_43_24]